jgi:integrase
MRLKVPDRTGYVVKSTKERDASLAEDVARKEYASLAYKIENNFEIETYDFEKLYQTWWIREKPSKSDARIRYIEGTVERYFLPYFTDVLSNKTITALTDLDFEDYWSWRIGYWDSPDGQENVDRSSRRRNNKGDQRHSKKGNIKKRPSDKSLQMEQSLLKQIFWWSHRRGIINRQPFIRAPKDASKKNLQVARRPTFELDEWRTLYRYMREWVKGEKVGEQPRKNGNFAKTRSVYKRPHSLHIFQRNLIRNYILFLANSGLRPNESRQLRWRDIRTNKDGHKYIYVRPTTKTGERDTFPLPHAFRYLERVREQSEYLGDDDLVFGNREGNPVENFGKTFRKFLTDANILYDSERRPRTIYSLRHFYATQRLSSKTKPIPMEVLAQNMGTSPQMMFTHYRHLTTDNFAEILTEI